MLLEAYEAIQLFGGRQREVHLAFTLAYTYAEGETIDQKVFLCTEFICVGDCAQQLSLPLTRFAF